MIFSFFISLGCSGPSSIQATLDTDSSSPTPTLEDTTSTLPSVVGGSSTINVTWVTNSETVDLEASVDSKATWSVLDTLNGDDGSHSFVASDYALPDGNVDFRLKTESQSIEIGSILVDSIAPAVSGTSGSTIRCTPFAPISVTLSETATDASSFTYSLVSGPSLGTLSDCLNDSLDLECTYDYTAGNASDVDVIQYRATDAAGNVSEIISFTVDMRGCS